MGVPSWQIIRNDRFKDRAPGTAVIIWLAQSYQLAGKSVSPSPIKRLQTAAQTKHTS